MEFNDLALRLGLALAIGFVIGLERGWHEREEGEGRRAAGLRTFALVGLLGGIFGVLSVGRELTLLAAGFIATSAALAAYMWREGEVQKDLSATSLVAAMLTFALGAFAILGDARAAAGASIATVILLAHKDMLHRWVERLTWVELRAGFLLGAMTFIALPLLPNRTIDPWAALNPYELWLMTILIAAVSFAGYAAIRIVGPRRGLTISAAIGGLFASTAVTLSLARLARANAGHVQMLAGGILAAGCVMLLRVLVVTALINGPLSAALAPVLLASAAGLGAFAFILVRADPDGAGGAEEFHLKNPFDLVEVLKFGLLLALVILATVLARRHFGDMGLLGLAAVSGLADVDAMTLAAARLPDALEVAANAILITVAVNSAAKVAYAWYAGGARIGAWALAGTGSAAAAGFLAWAAP